MSQVEGYFKSSQNANIFYQGWLPDGSVKGVILIVHGLGEHSSRYMNVVNHFVPLGYAIYSQDHIGHGRSEGPREAVKRFSDFTDSLLIYTQMLRNWQKDTPFFILGHSMGGLISSYFLLDHQDLFEGAIISAPPVKVSDTISPVTIFMGKILSILAPRLGVLDLETEGLSRDPKIIEAYINDPLVFHKKTPARLAAEMLSAMKRVAAEMGNITLPLMIMQGTKDRIVDPDGAQMLYNGVGSKDRSIQIYDGLYHEIFNEPEKDRVLGDVEAWLTERIS